LNFSNQEKKLVISRVFLPKEGGIEDYAYNRCLQDTNEVIVLTSQTPNYKIFDQRQDFLIHRWPSPPFLEKSKFGKAIKQIWYMACEFFMAIKLYSAYKYNYIEWFHGYDFVSLLLLSYILPVKYFIYLHGDDLLRPLCSPILKSLFSLTIARSEGVICNSKYTKDLLFKEISPEVKSFVINPSIRKGKFDIDPAASIKKEFAREKLGISKSAIVILSVGRLVRRKGFDRVIRSLPKLLDAGINAHYIICGRGEMLSELELISEQLEVSERVHFEGYVAEKELPNYYASCDIFAMPTVYIEQTASIEGFGIVYLEAGYFEKPVIASRVGGVVDAVRHKENGLLVDPSSFEDFLQALICLCNDETLRYKLGKKGKQFACMESSHRIIYEK
jgi:phosphatidylinositol alpha-1,6-mannosyltransferase